jgi:hypothetical protein
MNSVTRRECVNIPSELLIPAIIITNQKMNESVHHWRRCAHTQCRAIDDPTSIDRITTSKSSNRKQLVISPHYETNGAHQ